MTTNINLFNQASLSEAAYADLTSSVGIDKKGQIVAALESIDGIPFSPTQAAEFAKKYRVISHTSNAASGFSATVFEDIDTRKKTVAVRGTENLTDWDTNINGIGKYGFAVKQAIDAYNYINLLKAGIGENYTQAELQIDNAKSSILGNPGLSSTQFLAKRNEYINQGYWVFGNNVYALNVVNSSTTKPLGSPVLSGNYDIVGHSLGGHFINRFAANDGEWRVVA